MNSKSTYYLLIANLFLAACTTPAPTYKYSSPLPSDPTISFESDFDMHTHFSVNNKAPEQNNCADFDSAGYLLKKDSIFIYDKANRNLQIKAPADKLISVSAYHSFGDPSYKSSCGPLTRAFVPEKMKEYMVKMNVQDKTCFISVQSIDSTGKATPVKATVLPKCEK